MAEININIEAAQNEPHPASERSIFAFGWVRFKSSPNRAGSRDDEMRVLGALVVKDSESPNSVTDDRSMLGENSDARY